MGNTPEWREANREKQREWNRAYAARRRAGGDLRIHWREQKAKQRANSPAAREKNRQTALAWAREHPDLHRAKQARRRARLKGAAGTDYTTAQHIAWRFAFYGNRCVYCHAPATSIDHRIALARGGSHWPANLVPACKTCNSRKGARTDVRTP